MNPVNTSNNLSNSSLTAEVKVYSQYTDENNNYLVYYDNLSGNLPLENAFISSSTSAVGASLNLKIFSSSFIKLYKFTPKITHLNYSPIRLNFKLK